MLLRYVGIRLQKVLFNAAHQRVIKTELINALLSANKKRINSKIFTA